MIRNVHVFTNVTENIRTHRTIKETISSFISRFGGDFLFTIWCDVHPNEKLEDIEFYFNYLKKEFPFAVVNKTQGMTKGYLQMLEQEKEEFVFILEHDWVLNEKIECTLKEVTETMKQDNLLSYCFARENNVIQRFKKDYLKASPHSFVRCGSTSYIKSYAYLTHPHVLSIPLFKKYFMKYLNKEIIGRGGIEQRLRDIDKKEPEVNMAIFGTYRGRIGSYHIDGLGGSERVFQSWDLINEGL